MADPFRRAAPASGIGRALQSKRATLFENIEGLLADSPRLRDVSVEVLGGLCNDQGVDLERKFKSDRKHLYHRFLAHCLEDRVVSEEESADLDHLRVLLRLAPEDVAAVQDEVAQEVYGHAIQDVLADLDLDPAEEAFLRRLRGELQISEEVAKQLYAEGRTRARDHVLSAASSGDMEFLLQRAAAGEFTGSSPTAIEDAVTDALTKATLAIPALHWFELTQIAGYTAEGRPTSWHVKLRAGIPPEK